MTRFFSEAQLREMAEEFDRNGYLRVERWNIETKT